MSECNELHNVMVTDADALTAVLTISNVVGAVLIITIIEHYFSKSLGPVYTQKVGKMTSFMLVIAAVVIALGYTYFAKFYRSSAREMKRLGNLFLYTLWNELDNSSSEF